MFVATAGVLAAGIGFVIPAAIFLGLGVNGFQRQRYALPKPTSKERELLPAIRDNGGSVTSAEAAMETSLTVRKADGMLSELAAGGHLIVESKNRSLFYSLASSSEPDERAGVTLTVSKDVQLALICRSRCERPRS